MSKMIADNKAGRWNTNIHRDFKGEKKASLSKKNWTDIKVKPPFLSYRWFGQDVKTEALTSSMFPLLWFLSRCPRQSSRNWETLKSWSEEKCALRNLKTSELGKSVLFLLKHFLPFFLFLLLLVLLLCFYRSGLWRQKTLAWLSPDAVTATDASLKRENIKITEQRSKFKGPQITFSSVLYNLCLGN